MLVWKEEIEKAIVIAHIMYFTRMDEDVHYNDLILPVYEYSMHLHHQNNIMWLWQSIIIICEWVFHILCDLVYGYSACKTFD